MLESSSIVLSKGDKFRRTENANYFKIVNENRKQDGKKVLMKEDDLPPHAKRDYLGIVLEFDGMTVICENKGFHNIHNIVKINTSNGNR